MILLLIEFRYLNFGGKYINYLVSCDMFLSHGSKTIIRFGLQESLKN